MKSLPVLVAVCLALVCNVNHLNAQKKSVDRIDSQEIDFKTHDGYDLFGKLVLPASKPRAIVIYVQCAEGMTVDMKRPLGRKKTFNYFDLYRKELIKKNIGFFSYEGRGVRMGDELPRFEEIDREIYNTSTLDNKVKDLLTAVRTVRQQEGCGQVPIILMGASEGTLLIAEAASRDPDSVSALVMYGVLTTNLSETFKYIMSDGGYLSYRIQFDSDKDGVITKTEFEEDAKKFRKHALQGAEFSIFDKDNDGSFKLEEFKTLTKVYLDAVDNKDFKTLQAWSKAAAAVSVPDNWFEDHFAHDTMWSFLSKLDIPVGCFHGALDTNTSIDHVKSMEATSKKAGKNKVEFHYFDHHDHALDIVEYFTKKKMPAGHIAIFEFIDRVAPKQ